LTIGNRKVSRRDIKRHILELLEQSRLEEIYHFFETNPQHLVLNSLFGALCNPVETVRWNSICSFGLVVPSLAEKNIEDARIVMRRFLWSLNDESGGIGWGAPESLAEIMCHCRQLRHEYLHILISYMCRDGEEIFQDGNYLELPMLQRGLIWGVGRLSQYHLDEMAKQNIVENVVCYLSSPDKNVAGMALWTLGLLNAQSTRGEISAFIGRSDLVAIFRDNFLREVEIGHLAEEALLSMSGAGLS
jgi:hypothetical protein